jgi:hypothetical protein
MPPGHPTRAAESSGRADLGGWNEIPFLVECNVALGCGPAAALLVDEALEGLVVLGGKLVRPGRNPHGCGLAPSLSSTHGKRRALFASTHRTRI